MNLAALLVILIASATGIDRVSDPALTAIAERRVVEVQGDFSHAGADPCCAEVIAWNSGQADPVTHVVEQWRSSPPHWSILSDPAYTAIGCAVAPAGDRTYAVCVLAVEASVALGPATVAGPASALTEQLGQDRTTGPTSEEFSPGPTGSVATELSVAPPTSPPPPPVEMLPDAAMVAP